MTDKEKIKQEIERRMNNLWYLIPEGEKVLKDDFTKDDANNLGKYTALESLLKFIDSLPESKEQPKFKVGDMVISTINPSLTYKVLQVGLPNDLGNLDYEVEIFINGKSGIRTGSSFKEHNIQLICCDKMDEWGKLISEEPTDKTIKKNYSERYKRITQTEQFKKSYGDKSLGKEEFVSEDLDSIVISLEETIGTSPHSREVIKEHLQKAAEWQRQQMMKDALDATILDIDAQTIEFGLWPEKLLDIKEGDKVKIIIIKENG